MSETRTDTERTVQKGMIAYVAEQGCYSDKFFAGIFSSPEAAMAAFKAGSWTHKVWGGPDDDQYEDWFNDLDWDEAVSIKKVVVDA